MTNFQNFKMKIRGAVRSFTVMVNVAFLAALPLYDEAVKALPDLQPYIPENIYRKVGVAVVVINILLRFRTRRALEHK